MFIIWGSRSMTKKLASGSFFCPGCRGNTGYTHLRYKRWFTLYFIPVFPTSVLGEVVHCQSCGGDYKPEVLQYSQQAIEAALSTWNCSRCGSGNNASVTTCLRCGSPRVAALPAPQAEIEVTYYLHRNGVQEGPFTRAEIRAGLQSGLYADVDLIWNESKNL